MSTDALTLYQLNRQIKECISVSLPEAYWIVAEISEININRSGHCYLELIEKDQLSDKIVARARGIIWAYTFRILRSYFENTTGRELEQGMRVLVQVKVEFHEIFSFSLNIVDIDPTFTLGDLAKKRLEIIQQLKDEGIFDMNKETILPEAPQKIAIISSETAAGYGDFINQLNNNSYRFHFYLKLFPAIMQGDDTEASIISALDKIYQYVDFFDAVVIIRGGGSRSDLSCFDNYWLCCNVAQFPLPILTGIGHDRDESIVDLVAHTQLKTPTAVAEFLITGLADFFETITDLESHFFNALKEKMTTDKNKINQLSQRFPPIIRNIVEKKSHELQVYQIQLKNSVSLKLTESEVFLKKAIRTLNYDVKTMVLSQQQRLNFCGLFLSNSVDNILKLQTGKLQYFENTVQILHPKNTLKRGYSITTKNGKIIKSLTELNTGERIETEFFDGKINSKVL